MKKERAIIIKDPRLRKARNELRVLLKLWKSDITSVLFKKVFTYIENNNDSKAREFHNKISDLDLLECNSITTCPQCGFSDKDMAYVPSMTQWICVECNTKRVHVIRLRESLLTEMTMKDIEIFLKRLSGEDGIELSRSGSMCNGYEDSKRILDEMGFGKETQDRFLELCGHYSGYCDCEILLNSARHFFKQ